MPKVIRGILFDYFGTLIDYQHDRMQHDYPATHACMTSLGVDLGPDETRALFDGCFNGLEAESRASGLEFSMFDVVERVLHSRGLTASEAERQALVDAYLDDWRLHLQFLPNLPGHLRRLADRFVLGLVTNTHHAPMIHDLLDAQGIRGYFDVVVTSVEFGRPKPAPGIFEYALRELKLAADEAVYVGDSFTNDYGGALAAGMKGYLVGRHERVPLHRQVPSVFDLPSRL